MTSAGGAVRLGCPASSRTRARGSSASSGAPPRHRRSSTHTGARARRTSARRDCRRSRRALCSRTRRSAHAESAARVGPLPAAEATVASRRSNTATAAGHKADRRAPEATLAASADARPSSACITARVLPPGWRAHSGRPPPKRAGPRAVPPRTRSSRERVVLPRDRAAGERGQRVVGQPGDTREYLLDPPVAARGPDHVQMLVEPDGQVRV